MIVEITTTRKISIQRVKEQYRDVDDKNPKSRRKSISTMYYYHLGLSIIKSKFEHISSLLLFLETNSKFKTNKQPKSVIV